MRNLIRFLYYYYTIKDVFDSPFRADHKHYMQRVSLLLSGEL